MSERAAREDDLTRLGDVPLELRAVLARGEAALVDVLGLRPGTILMLDRAAGAPVELESGGTSLGVGEVVVQRNRIAVRVTELVPPSTQRGARRSVTPARGVADRAAG